jgi:probable rRNA maturation factor
LSSHEPVHGVVEVQIAPILVETERQNLGLVDPLLSRRLEAAAMAALQHERRSGEVTLVLTVDQSIQELNRDFLGEDRPTDVLSFSAQEEVGPFVSAPETGGYLGDVIISYPRAVQQASEHSHSVEQELDLLVVHGLLHLLGYDHATEEEKALMWSHQESILAGLKS